MTKIAHRHQGSTVFAKNLLGNILSYPTRQRHYQPAGLDPERADYADRGHVSRKDSVRSRASKRPLNHHTALTGANYAISMFQIAGYKPGAGDRFREVLTVRPAQETIAHALGIGGIMRGLRTISSSLGCVRDIEIPVPRCHPAQLRQSDSNEHLQNRPPPGLQPSGSAIASRGRPSSLPTTSRYPWRRLTTLAAGINHMVPISFERKTVTGAEDLMPRLRQVVAEGLVPRFEPRAL